MSNLEANDLSTDFKAVTLAAEMIEQKIVNAEQLIISPLGARKRAYSKEIAGFSKYESVYRGREITSIQINREGLYDMLPEGIFHRPPASSLMIDEEQMIKDIVQRREEEKEARNFFAPMEAELYRLRTAIEIYESHLDRKNEYDDLINIFLKEWKEFKCFSKQQMVIFLQVLPVIHEHRNDIAFISSVFKMMFKLDVQLEYVTVDMEIPPEIAEAMDTKIGQGTLGVNFIAGRASGKEEELRITIGPASADQILNFLPGSAFANAMDVMLSYFIPLQTSVSTKFVMEASSQKMVIGDEASNSCMGYTTYLGAQFKNTL